MDNRSNLSAMASMSNLSTMSVRSAASARYNPSKIATMMPVKGKPAAYLNQLVTMFPDQYHPEFPRSVATNIYEDLKVYGVREVQNVVVLLNHDMDLDKARDTIDMLPDNLEAAKKGTMNSIVATHLVQHPWEETSPNTYCVLRMILAFPEIAIWSWLRFTSFENRTLINLLKEPAIMGILVKKEVLDKITEIDAWSNYNQLLANGGTSSEYLLYSRMFYVRPVFKEPLTDHLYTGSRDIVRPTDPEGFSLKDLEDYIRLDNEVKSRISQVRAYSRSSGLR